VARLKGGDPFVLGRGSEEVLACAESGVPVEVIPGISSAIAAPAAAGIPVTHRGLSTGFVVVSGHVVDDLSAVAATGLTVVVLMGVATLPRLVEEFIAAGRASSTPVAVIHRAFDPAQRVVVGSLADIQQRVVSAAITNPSVIVVGDVVGVVPRLEAEVLAS
jgi:siroheme synthase